MHAPLVRQSAIFTAHHQGVVAGKKVVRLATPESFRHQRADECDFSYREFTLALSEVDDACKANPHLAEAIAELLNRAASARL